MTEPIDLSNIEVAIIAARPVRWTDWPQEVQDFCLGPIWKDGGVEPPLYPGSIYRPCEGCEVQIAVGPRSQQVINEANADPARGVYVGCFYCATKYAADNAAKDEVIPFGHLGNPYRRKT